MKHRFVVGRIGANVLLRIINSPLALCDKGRVSRRDLRCEYIGCPMTLEVNLKSVRGVFIIQVLTWGLQKREILAKEDVRQGRVISSGGKGSSTLVLGSQRRVLTVSASTKNRGSGNC